MKVAQLREGEPGWTKEWGGGGGWRVTRKKVEEVREGG